MFTSSEVPTATTTTPTPSNAVSPPQSPSRIGRLRGLSYLRNYTLHLHSRTDNDSRSRNSDHRHPSTDNTSPASDREPSPSAVSTAPANTPTNLNPASPAPTSTPSSNTTSGWLPALHGPTSGVTANSTAATIASNIALAYHPKSNPPKQLPSSSMTRNSAESMGAGTKDAHHLPSIRFIPHHDPRATRPSLTFQAVSRTLPTLDSIIKVGRYSERDAQPGDIPRNTPSSAPVGFKSKVVSRRHCEFWCENSQWYIKDVKSSSGTFLNHLRLSPPGVESRPWPINDGDVVQLGIDFRGGEEMIFRCVKIRIELNRGWQKGLNNFNKTTHKRLRKLADSKPKRDSDTASLSSSECAICLMAVSPCQSLFVAPCSHVWHYKCIRPILNGTNYPQFLCPNCRAVADLEADIEEAESDWEDDLKEAIEASKQENEDTIKPNEQNGSAEQPIPIDLDGDSPMPDVVRGPPDRPAPPPPIVEPAVAAAEPDEPPAVQSKPPEVTQAIASTSSPAVPIPGRTISPGTRRYELMSHGPGEGPMTPRNDAGPFVLDGGAGQAGQSPEPNGLGIPRSRSHISLTQAEDIDT